MSPADTAHHEAGHAVAHWLLGQPVVSLTVVADEDNDSLGLCRGEGFPDWFQPDVGTDDEHRLLAERHIVAMLAGAAAERHYRSIVGEHDDEAVNDGASHDYGNAFDLASYFMGSDAEIEPFLEWLAVRTTALVGNNWHLVEGLAGQLLVTPTMTGDEVADCLFRIRFPGRTRHIDLTGE